MLPELGFGFIGIHEDELYFKDSGELVRVLSQKNPVYLVLDLPGMLTQVFICFPTTCTTRVYIGCISLAGLLANVIDPIYSAPLRIEYRYGMRLLPWMFFGHLDNETHRQRSRRDNIVNYIVLSSMLGYTGALIRVFRGHESSQKKNEWFEIYHFRNGNDYRFVEEWRTNLNTKMIARFVPEHSGTPGLIWKPESRENLPIRVVAR